MQRQPLTWHDATTRLRDFSITTLRVCPVQLQGLLPSRFTPFIIDLDGLHVGLVSAVTFRDTTFRFGWMWPWWWADMWQTNYRAYVIDREDGAVKVWFFNTMLGSISAHIPRFFWKMPWIRSRYQAAITADHWSVSGQVGQDHLFVKLVPESGKNIFPGFASEAEALQVLAHPAAGYYHATDGTLCMYTVWHSAIANRRATLDHFTCSVFQRLGLIHDSEIAQLHSVIIADAVDFEIYLPPKRCD